MKWYNKKRILTSLAFFFGTFATKAQLINESMIIPSNSFYNLRYIDINGKTQSTSSFKGKKIMIVNVASECGYTNQYKDLQALAETRKDLIIVGFPSNQFGDQEPGNNEEIQHFCSKNYQVTFPLASKIDVKGKTKAEIYQWLTSPEMNGWNSQEPNWNFNKYVINEEGVLLGWFPSRIKPMDEQIIKLLESK